ncbi:chloride channel protein [Altericroceibacterium xinjiangense]|uniref:chloride channel protein n=1 Tax=Altericroceibacterium xinjiangense TaxID=762261 RepID=UPI000F7F3AA5|nr:chloride channel protein [Altericroceibacterium xinjiangense]
MARRGTKQAIRFRRWLRSSELSLVVLAALIGLGAGLATALIGAMAHGLQYLLYGVGINRLSALASIRHPYKLLALPLGGLLLGGIYYLSRKRKAPVDVVEANALHGGRIPRADSLWVTLQTVVSNGFGASVGLEAAYAQAGGGLASVVGQWLRLRRADLRNLVGAGAGAAIGAAFSAPLTGAFYAFEVVIGAYTPAAIVPVAAAALIAALVGRALGAEPYLTVTAIAEHITTLDYLLFAGLGIVCALCGIAMIRLEAWVSRWVARSKIPVFLRPMIGGFLLIPIVWLSPQALSSGHGALRLELALSPPIPFLLFVFSMKVAASILSLSFGFRGGLFFASLFLGSMLGPIYAQAINGMAGYVVLGELDAALVGMAAFAVAVIGAPMTLSLLVLETTQDFALTGAVITASLCATAFTRANFGYSFSTWRLHLRGSNIRSPRDIGWTSTLTARRLMRRHATILPDHLTVAQFRVKVPLGSTSRVLLADNDRKYAGIVDTARGYDPSLDPDAPIASVAGLNNQAIGPELDISAVLDRFERLGCEELAVIDLNGRILGVVTEKYVHRRYIEESEKAQGELFGE